jgi:hypothetical protein
MRTVRVSWKIIGLAGLAGVAATGVIVARKRRVHRDYDSDELRQRLHERLVDASNRGQRPTEPGDPQHDPDQDAPRSA